MNIKRGIYLPGRCGLWRIVFTRRFEKALEKLDREVAVRVLRKVEILSRNPYVGKMLRGVYVEIEDLRLKLYSLRVGDYRVIYTVNPLESKVYLLTVKHRKHVYKEI